MSLVSEIVVEQGNEFTNFEVAYWRNGGVEWASLNDSLHYFGTWSDAIDFYEDIIQGVA